MKILTVKDFKRYSCLVFRRNICKISDLKFNIHQTVKYVREQNRAVILWNHQQNRQMDDLSDPQVLAISYDRYTSNQHNNHKIWNETFTSIQSFLSLFLFYSIHLVTTPCVKSYDDYE